MRIIPRHEWGARPPKSTSPWMKLPASEFWVHHSVTNPTSDPAADARHVQQVAFSRKFSDISYSYLVHPDGTVLEGRGLRVGAHTKKRNSIALALCFIGNYSLRDPTPEQMESGRWLIQLLEDTGSLRRGAPVLGHRQNPASPSECPGNRLYPRLIELRHPSLRPPAPNPEEGELSVSDISEIIERLNNLDERVDDVLAQVVGIATVVDREINNVPNMPLNEEVDELRRASRGELAIAVHDTFVLHDVDPQSPDESVWERCYRIAGEITTGKRTWDDFVESLLRISGEK